MICNQAGLSDPATAGASGPDGLDILAEDQPLPGAAAAGPANPVLDRRGLLAALGGVALTASGLLVPASLVEEAGASESPLHHTQERTRQRNRKQRNRQQRNRHERGNAQGPDTTLPGRGLLKNILFTRIQSELSGRFSQPVIVFGNDKSSDQIWVAPGGSVSNVPLNDDEGWIVVQQGVDQKNRYFGFGIYLENPTIGTPWFVCYTNARVTRAKVVLEHGSSQAVPRTDIREGESSLIRVAGNWDLHLTRLPDSNTKNFELIIRPPTS